MQCKIHESTDDYGLKTVIVENVEWRCPDCGFAFNERQMKDAPQKYVAKNPIAIKNGTRSFFVNAFSSPWLSWNTIMKEWFEAKGDPVREQVVVNTRFAETYRTIGAYEDESVFLKRRELYDAELPHGVLLLTAAVDVQDNRLEYEICGWGMGEECWGIKKGVVMGRPNERHTWQVLDGILDRPYRMRNGTAIKISRTFIDTGGHFTTDVYQYCQRNRHKQRIGIKGKGGAGLPLNYKTTMLRDWGIPLQILGVNDGKQQVLTRLGKEETGAQYFHFPFDDNVLGVRGYDEIYFKGIISEQKKIRVRGGQIYVEWEPISREIRNEPLDLRVYNLACIQSLNVKPAQWRELAAMMGVAVPQGAQQKKKRPTGGAPRQMTVSANLY